jgi:predicted porin
MKKSLVALAALAVMGAASAQSSVTMYGAVEPTVDFGYKNTTTTTTQTLNAAGAVIATPSVVTTQYKPGFRVQDGNDQGTGTSRIGWLGTEDLGGGLKAKFQLEMGLRVDDGCATTVGGLTTAGVTTTATTNGCSSGNSGGNLFGRNAWLGLEGSLGEVRLGRQVLGSFGVQGKSWAAGSSSGLYEAGGAVTTAMGGVRFSNAIKYITPNFGGFTGTVTLGAPELAPGTAAANNNNTTTTTPGVVATADTKAKTGIDLALEYANGPLYVGGGYNRGGSSSSTNNGLAGALNSVNSTEARTKQHTLGASYDFGVIKPFINYTRSNTDASNVTVTGGTSAAALAANTPTKAKAWSLGLRAPIGAATLIAAYGREKTTGAGTALTASAVTGTRSFDGREKAYQIGAQYPLSKRTLLEVNYGQYKNDNTTRDNTVAAGVVTGGTQTIVNNKISALNFGIKHSF